MYVTRPGHARPLYKRYKHSTHVHCPGWPCRITVQGVQARHTLCDGTTTVRVQTRVSRYITRAGQARTMYREYKHSTHVQWYKHSTSMSKISTWPVLATSNTVQVVHAQYIRASNTHVYYPRRPSHHAISCTTHAYTYSRRVVQRSGCKCRPPYTHTHIQDTLLALPKPNTVPHVHT